jgi:3-hydroxyacyl-[acyl-carrier-protein] dehydratase
MRASIAAAMLGEPGHGQDGATVFEFRFAPDDPVFAGHFPGRPILPGVFQLELVRMAAERMRPGPLTVGEIRKAKFQRPILPGETARLALKLSEKAGTMQAHARFSVVGQPAGEMLLLLWRKRD